MVSEPTNTDLLHAIEGLGTRINRLDARIDRLDGRIDGVHTRLDVLAGRVDTLIDVCAEIRIDLSQHRHDD